MTLTSIPQFLYQVPLRQRWLEAGRCEQYSPPIEIVSLPDIDRSIGKKVTHPRNGDYAQLIPWRLADLAYGRRVHRSSGGLHLNDVV